MRNRPFNNPDSRKVERARRWARSAFPSWARPAMLAAFIAASAIIALLAASTSFLAEATRHPNSALDAGDETLETIVATGEETSAEQFISEHTDEVSLGATGNANAVDQPTATASWRELLIKPGDTITSLLAPFVAAPTEIHALVNANRDAKRLARIRAGETISVQVDANDYLVALRYAFDDTNALLASRTTAGFDVRVEAIPLDRRIEHASGVIETSLFASAQTAGLSDAATLKLAQIFGWDIDFALDLRQEDRYAVVYEQAYHNEQVVGQPQILAAEFVNDGKTYRAVYYRDRNGRGDYYTPDGKLMRKAFFRTPVDFTRISSTFSVGRYHPVLNRIRAHRGVDYAAPTGTPVKATADGTVAALGSRGGFGKTIVLQHGKRYTTLYAHLTRYARGLRSGSKVRQGDVIGYVGQTGLATGPHLHYEFRVDGVHRNPLSVKVDVNESIPNAEKQAFQEATQSSLARLDVATAHAVAANSNRPSTGEIP